MKNNRILILATSHKTRGGISSVIRSHKQGEQWKKHKCLWIETHRDGSCIRKIFYLIRALIYFCILIPFYNIVHIHIATTISARRKQLFFIIAKLLHKKIIFHFHPSNEDFLLKPSTIKLYRNLFSKADLVLVLSKKWQQFINQTLGLDNNIKILYNPCPIVNQREDQRRNYILFAGTLNKRKGFEDLLNAFSKIANEFPDWKIVFAGNGELSIANQLAKSLGIMNQVLFLGWISGKRKENTFQHASIYCLTSYGEGFPMGVLDAWAYKIPCIMTPVGGIPDIVTDGINGLIYPVGDIVELSKKLRVLITNESLRKNIVQETDKYVTGIFSQNNINQKLDNIYSEISTFNQ